MSKKREIINELTIIYGGEAWHGDNLVDALAGITAEKASRRPVPGAHTIWEVVGHITAWNDVWATRLGGRDMLEPDENFPAGKTDEEWMAALENLKRSHFELTEKIENVRDEDMPHEFMTKGYTLEFFLKGIVRHTVYHTGQLALLKNV